MMQSINPIDVREDFDRKSLCSMASEVSWQNAAESWVIP